MSNPSTYCYLEREKIERVLNFGVYFGLVCVSNKYCNLLDLFWISCILHSWMLTKGRAMYIFIYFELHGDWLFSSSQINHSVYWFSLVPSLKAKFAE